jgi:hypothetical protein
MRTLVALKQDRLIESKTSIAVPRFFFCCPGIASASRTQDQRFIYHRPTNIYSIQEQAFALILSKALHCKKGTGYMYIHRYNAYDGGEKLMASLNVEGFFVQLCATQNPTWPKPDLTHLTQPNPT